MNPFSVLSEKFEQALLEYLTKVFEKLLASAEKNAIKKRYVKRTKVSSYVDVSAKTLLKWEKEGLKRIEPVDGGDSYYDLQEIDRFMNSKKY